MATTQTQDAWTNSHEPNIKEKMTQKLTCTKRKRNKTEKITQNL